MAETGIRHAIAPAAAAVRAVGVVEGVPWHSHSGAVLVLMDAGARVLATPLCETCVRAGTGVAIPAGQAHAWAPSPEGCSYRALAVPDTATDAAGAIADAAWVGAFEAAFAAVETRASDAAQRVAVLMRASALCAPSRWRVPLEPAAVRRARRLSHDDPAATLHLKDIARRAGLSAFHLHRLYRRAWGVTPAQHRLEARLRFARAVLVAGGSAAAAGFADQSHLTRAFRRFMGVPPERWRRQVTAATDFSMRTRRRIPRSP